MTASSTASSKSEEQRNDKAYLEYNIFSKLKKDSMPSMVADVLEGQKPCVLLSCN